MVLILKLCLSDNQSSIVIKLWENKYSDICQALGQYCVFKTWHFLKSIQTFSNIDQTSSEVLTTIQ
jgi:hypothetical protein